jgi:hypothetical protein
LPSLRTGESALFLYADKIEERYKGEEITRMVDAQWISRTMEATHMDSLVNRVQERHIFDTWGGATMEWLKKKCIKKYHGMRTRGLMTGTDNKIKSKAVRTARLI